MIAARAGLVKPAPKIGVPFAPLPLDLKARRDVSPAAKLVFATVANQARMRRGEFANLTNRRIAERAGLSVATVRRALDDLEAHGLVRRLFGESKRIRLGIAVTYQAEGVAQPGATRPSPGVARQPQPGCPPPPQEGCAPGATDLLRGREEHRETISSLDSGTNSDPASRVAEGPEAAAYLRACVAAGKRGEAIPPPPVFAHVQNAGASMSQICDSPARLGLKLDRRPREVDLPPAAPAGPGYGVGPGRPFLSPQDDIPSIVGRMVGSLGERLKAEGVGPRRLSQRQLARQLAILRARRDGKKPARGNPR